MLYARRLQLAQPNERKNGDNDDNGADEPDDAVHEMSPFIGQWVKLKTSKSVSQQCDLLRTGTQGAPWCRPVRWWPLKLCAPVGANPF